MTHATVPTQQPEDENADPVGQPAAPTTENGDDPPHPPFSPNNEPDIAPE